MTTEPMSYVARCNCGGRVMIIPDTPASSDVSQVVRRYKNKGFTIEHMTTAQARSKPRCITNGYCVKREMRA